ncbi:MAG TPA: hypothetical protein DCM62_06855 [Bacteroidales bacterium]|nr:hypothetical protein [Bacteroidales bacterium]
MKQILSAVVLSLVFAGMVYGQARDVRRASAQIGRGNLALAKQYIDAALNDPRAAADAQTFTVRAQVYMEIFNSPDSAVRNLHPDPLAVADQALIRAQELDTENRRMLDIQRFLLILPELIYNNAVEHFQNNRFEQASNAFMRSFDIVQTSFNTIDTTTLYNAALAAEMGNNFPKALELYNRLIELNYPQPFIFSSLATIQLAKGDTAKALEVLGVGREKYPENLNLIFTEANIYIFTRQTDKAKNILQLAVNLDPLNPNLHFALGANFDNMAQDTLRTVEDRLFAYNQAVQAYQRAIEINPEYFDAIYNLGVLHFNEGVRIFEAADRQLRKNPTTAGFRAYQVEEKRFQEQWLKAQPFLEKALTMINSDDPNYDIVIVSLMQLYARTNQPEKLQEIQAIYRQIRGTEE